MERFTEEMRVWLFDLAHGNLTAQDVLRGFIKHYVSYGFGPQNVVQDIYFHTAYGEKGAQTADTTLRTVLKDFVNGTYRLEVN